MNEERLEEIHLDLPQSTLAMKLLTSGNYQVATKTGASMGAFIGLTLPGLM
jgi:hypothetical protein